jgi:hypothetical protein
MSTEFGSVAKNVLGSSVMNLVYITNSGAYDFEVAPRSLEILCTPGLK